MKEARQHPHQRQASCSNWACCGTTWGRFACSAHLQRNDEGSLFEKRFEEELLKKLPKAHVILMDNAAVHEQRSFTENCGKILAEIDSSAAIFAGLQSHWTYVERFKAKSCLLCSPLWFRFSGSECDFKRQLYIAISAGIIKKSVRTA